MLEVPVSKVGAHLSDAGYYRLVQESSSRGPRRRCGRARRERDARLLADATGLTSGLSAALSRPEVLHDRGVVLRDVAVSIASGAQNLAGTAVLRDQPRQHRKGPAPQRPQPSHTRQTTADLMKHDFAEALTPGPARVSCVCLNGADTPFLSSEVFAAQVRLH
jgi:hypothetical protein